MHYVTTMNVALAYLEQIFIYTQPSFTSSEFTIETLEQGVKYVQS